MSGKKLFILAIAVLLFAMCIIFSLSDWEMFFDKSHEHITMEEFHSGKRPSSVNLTIEGNALFEYTSIQTKTQDNVAGKTKYLVPIVDSTWQTGGEIFEFLEFEVEKESYHKRNESGMDKLDSAIDSMITYHQGRVKLEVVHTRYSFIELDSDERAFFEDEFGLNLGSKFNLSRFSVDKKQSNLMLIISGILALLFPGIWLYYVWR